MSLSLKIAIAGLVFFILISLGLQVDLFESFDRAVLALFKLTTSDTWGHWLIEVFRDITALGSNAVLGLVSVAALALLIMARQVKTAGLFILMFSAVVVISSILKHTVDRPRPLADERSATVFTKSYPSAHAMHSSAVYLALAGLFWLHVRCARKYKLALLNIAIFTSLLVGITRLNLGVHWPTDILAGWALGVTFASLLYTVAYRLVHPSQTGH